MFEKPFESTKINDNRDKSSHTEKKRSLGVSAQYTHS